MTVNAGSVSIRLAADFNPADFERFDKAIARAEAKQKIEAKLGASFDPSGFTAYTKAVDRAVQRTERRGAFKAALGGEFDPSAFRAAERAIQKAERDAQKGVTFKLDADAKPAERELFRIRERAAATRSEIAKGATFHVNTAVARAELDLLERKAHQTERAMAESRLTAAGFGDGGGGGSGLLTGIGGAAAAGGALTAALAGASGIVAGLAGAATALAGSLGAAAAGAGALGTAAAGVMAPALGLGIATASRFTAVLKANQLQSKATLTGTAADSKAARLAMSQLSGAERDFAGQLRSTAGVLKGTLRPATDGVVKGLGSALRSVTPLIRSLRTNFTGLGASVGGSFATFGRELARPEWTRFFKTMTDAASRITRDVTPGFIALARIFRNIATASLPYLEKGTRAVSGWLQKIAGEAGNAGRLHNIVGGLVGQFSSWAKFGGTVARLLGTIFMGGAQQGRGLVDTLTRILDRWTKFLNTPKGQADMRQFFRDAVGVTKLLGGNLGWVLGLWGKVARASLHFVNGLPGPLKSALGPLAAMGVTIGLLASKFGFVGTALKAVLKRMGVDVVASRIGEKLLDVVTFPLRKLGTLAAAPFKKFQRWLIGASAKAGAEAGAAEGEAHAAGGSGARLARYFGGKWGVFKRWLLGASAVAGAEAGVAQGEAMTGGQGLLSGGVRSRIAGLGKGGALLGAFKGLGRLFGAAMGVAVVAKLLDKIKPLRDKLRDKVYGPKTGSSGHRLYDPNPIGSDLGDKALHLIGGLSPFASGGQVPGGFGGGDVVPARLEPGEHVWTKDEVRRAGGHRVMHRLRRMVGGGGQAAGPGYAQGGMVAAHLDVATGVEAERKRAQRPLAGIRDDLASIARAATHAGTATHQVLGARLGDARKAVAAQTGRLRKTAGDDFEGVRKDTEAKTRRTHDDTDDRWTDLRKRLGHTTDKWRTDTLGVFDDVRKSAGKTTSRLADSVTGNLEDARKGAVRRVTQLRDTVTDRFDDARKNVGRKTKQLSDTVIGRLEDARRGGSRRAGQLAAAVVGSAGDMERGTTRHLTAVRTVVADRMEGARRTGAMRGGQLRDAVAGSMGSLDTAVFRGMRYVGTATNEALKAFGAKPVSVSVQAPSKRAVGGWIGSPGEHGGDTELALLGRGEAVLNRHQQTHVDQALALSRAVGAGNFGSLDSLFGGVTTPHYFAKGGRVSEYAQGGKAGGTHWDRLVAAANQVSARNFPYVLGGGHEQPARLEPMDCSGAVSYAVQHAGYKVPTAATPGIPAWGFPRGPGRVTIFDKRFGPEAHTFMRIGNRFWGTSGFARPGGGAGWFNQSPGGGYLAGFEQFHLPDLGADAGSYIPGGGGGPANIKTPKIKGRGSLATIARSALTRAAGAATSRIDKTWSAMNPGGGQALGDTGGGKPGAPIRNLWGDIKPYNRRYPGHPTGTGGARLTPGIVRRIADWAGLPPTAFEQIAHGESSYYPGIYQNPANYDGSVGYGLWQMTNKGHDGGIALKYGGYKEMWNPIKDALAARDLYSSGGGLSHWFGDRFLTARNDRPRRSFPGGPTLPGRARGGFAGGLRRFASGGRARGHRPSAGHLAAPSPKNVISGRIGNALKGLGGDWGMSAVTDRLGVLDADYAREDRTYNVDVGVQDFVVPAVLDASGKVTSEAHLDARALGRKAQSLDRLVAIRRQMMGVIKDARAALGGTLAVLKDAIGKLRAARAHAKSKDRSGYSRLMGRYVADIKGVQDARGELFTMSQDAGLDLREVKNERRALLPGAQSALDQATAAAGGGVDTGSAGDTGSAFGDTGSVAGDTGGSAAGSMADVAAQAQQMFATFTQSRQDLFSQFGSNFTGAGGPGIDPGTAAAGARYWGAFGPGATGAAPPPDQSTSAPSSGAQITNYYAAPPPDPHTHSVQMLYELQALGG